MTETPVFIPECRVVLEVTSYAGLSMGGEHFYGKLRRSSYALKEEGTSHYWRFTDEGELFREVSQKEARQLAAKDRGKPWPITHRFNSEEELKEAARKVFHTLVEEGAYLVDEEGRLLAGRGCGAPG